MKGNGGAPPRRDPPPRVLIVEDEPDIAALIAYQLTREGFRVETVDTGSAGLTAIHREIPDLLVLDRMLPEMSGDEVLRTLRREGPTQSLPVLVLTAKREQEDRIEGLEMGADDYLGKPFSPRELVLRVEAILRRAKSRTAATGDRLLRVGPLTMDLGAHRVAIENEEVSLTPTEFRLLQAMIERRGRTQTRRQLLERAWDLDSDVARSIQTRTVDMHIRRLRGKLGELGDWVETVRGFGYRFGGPDPQS